MNTMFGGTGTAIVTPFFEDGTIDFSSLENVINHNISGGVDYIAVLGTTGEPATLTADEKKKVIAYCKDKIDGRVPMVVGFGGNNTAEIIKNIQETDFNGIVGILSVAPYYNKPSQEGIYQHFKAIADISPVPVIIYNVPGRTSSNIDANTVLRLANDCPFIVAVKEASGNMSQIMQIIKNKPDDFKLLSGDDALTLPMISLGCEGVISVVANSHPREFSTLVKCALNGDFEQAKKLQYQLVDYIDALFAEGSPSGVKAALEIMGLCEKHVRLPLAEVSEKHYVYLQELLNEN